MKILLALTLVIIGSPLFAQDWLDLTPTSGDAPSARRNAAAIYDSTGQRMIVFGGRGSAALNDVWAFSFATNTWQELTPDSGLAPAPRYTANAIYDPANHAMIIWSGLGSANNNDVWTFDLNARAWQEFMPPDPKPNPRYGTAAVFDPETRELVTFAGFTDSGRFDDTWRFSVDSVRWTDTSPDGARPVQRCLHSASYDSRNHRMIVYGGQSGGALDDIWALDMTTHEWSEFMPDMRPAGRWFPTHIYDRRNHRSLIFGGRTGTGASDETWEFDLETGTWRLIVPGGPMPAAREGAVAIYIESEDRMVVFGGRGSGDLNDVWSLNSLSASVGVAGEATIGPGTFTLYGNYPNPFNPSTTIAYELPQQGHTQVGIYDLHGRLIQRIHDGFQTAGTHRVPWDGTSAGGSRVGSGIYFVVVSQGSQSRVGKLTVLK